MNAYIVEQDALLHNIRELKRLANGVQIWAVLKGDGYGIGALPLARLLRSEGIDRFCVTELREAALLRENGFDDAEILMLRVTNDTALLRALLDLGVILTVGSTQSAATVSALAAGCGTSARVHLKVDTGMGRFGFAPCETEAMRRVFADPNLRVCGVFTHFNCAYGDEKLTRHEFAAFREVVASLRTAGLEPGMVHCCNSSAFLRFPEMHCDAVRLGSALLGRVTVRNTLRPVGYCLSAVDELHRLEKGQTTGYSAVWKAKRDTVAAIVPIGWYHGLRIGMKVDLNRKRDCLRAILGDFRAFLHGNATYVTIRGRKCRVIGVVGMLHCAVDVTGMEICPGDEVRLEINPLHVKGLPVEFRR